MTLAGGVGEELTTARTRWDGPRDEVDRPFCVGRFIVLDVVGAGGMGLVYSAYDPELDRKIAVKVVRAAAFAGLPASAGQARLMREAQSLARLSHPNVVTVHDVGVVEDAVFIAMEYVDGVTLRTWLKGQDQETTEPGAPRPRVGVRSGNRSWQTVLGVFLKAGRGLAAAHAAGMIHRDFKPDNVLVGRDGRVKVLDFGLAQAQGGEPGEPTEQGVAAPEGPAQETLVGVLGTPAYMAPEQHEGQSCDARADQFSFCVALWEGMYGSRPFVGTNAIELADAMRDGVIQPVPRDTRVPRWLHRVLLRGLARDPALRWPDMRTLLKELGRERERLRLRQLWLVAGLAAVLGLGVQLASVEHEPPPEAAPETVEALRGIERALRDIDEQGAGQDGCVCPGDAPQVAEKPVPADR